MGYCSWTLPHPSNPYPVNVPNCTSRGWSGRWLSGAGPATIDAASHLKICEGQFEIYAEDVYAARGGPHY